MNADASLAAGESPADSAITLLIDLAQRGEIDPWDVDVIKVVDRFLQDLEQQNQTHLPQSGQAFLWASMLVSLKADTLEALAETDEDGSEAEIPPAEEEKTRQHRLPQKLENHIRRRGSAPPPKRRRVTLSELITYLKELESQVEASPPPSQGKSRSASKRETAKMISHLAHNENLTELAVELEEFLWQEMSSLPPQQPWISLDHLSTRWERRQAEARLEELSEPMSERGNRVGIFWALLLLSAQSKVELSQEEFYQDLHLRFLVSENVDNPDRV
ncbi:condensin subunit ScpA [Halothece sp. PCC 7418]|uniref:segregation/condensation protein A n=1 Tax=Halothece sp. (strain PCC 7418) TaxID=65093 RepID=UPI0002A08AB8|nr:segregation/condensation protein A [Halothece sp. PCC 7418]AFZ43223.1 condensin subunit ScpA [Halothece sp. PCC 7418]